MSAVIPPNELVRRAAAWLAAERASRPDDVPLSRLLDDACMRFNLGPKDFLALEQLFSAPADKRNPL